MKDRYYCGPVWIPNFIRKLLSLKFNPSCIIHDQEYSEAANDSSISCRIRAKVDARFLDLMNLQAGKSTRLRILAFLYYLAVRVGGRLSWEKCVKGNTRNVK